MLGPIINKAIIINVQRQPGVNVIETTDNIRNLLPDLVSNLPKSVNVEILTDRTTTIRASVKDVQFELGLAIALVVMVIYLFYVMVLPLLFLALPSPLLSGYFLR